jgi:hypothetical protein
MSKRYLSWAAMLPLLLALGGCPGITSTPPAGNVVAASSASIGSLAAQVINAQKAGFLTVADEQALLDKLQTANNNLRLAETVIAVAAPGAPTSSSADLLTEVDQALTEVRTALAAKAPATPTTGAPTP